MSNNTVINHNTYAEITNGLFIDIPASRNIIRDESEGITREQFEAAYPRQSDGPDFDEAPFIIGTSPQENYVVGFDPVDLPDTITVTRNPNEETSHQLRNMPEQELIQYFDRISQEEEN